MSMQVIRLVQGDQLPNPTLTVLDSEGEVANIVGATGAVMFFRKRGTTTVLATVPCVVDTSAATVTLDFSGTVLDVEPGDYEGEVQLDFGGKTLTLYDTLRFKVREQFA